MTLIYLVRHGSTVWNHEKRAQGQADIDISAQGIEQAEAAAEELSGLGLAAVYSSDLKRAAKTAALIASRCGVPVYLDRDLREIDQGDWTGLHVDEIRLRWPDLWGPARHYSTRPGGESPADVRRRALGALGRVVEAHPEASVAVVSHGGTIRWISAEALGYDDRASARLRGVANGGIVSVEAARLDGGLDLRGLARLDGATTDVDDPND